jgi:hypothetical protein
LSLYGFFDNVGNAPPFELADGPRFRNQHLVPDVAAIVIIVSGEFIASSDVFLVQVDV